MKNYEERLKKGEKLTDIIQQYKGVLIGDKVYQKFDNQFPLLIKFIDANDNLSIQEDLMI